MNCTWVEIGDDLSEDIQVDLRMRRTRLTNSAVMLSEAKHLRPVPLGGSVGN